MEKKISLLLLVLLSGFFTQGQDSGFRWQRKLEGVSQTWHRLVLPEELYERLRPDLGDLRISGKDASGKELVAPYVLQRQKLEEEATSGSSFSIRAAHLTSRKGEYYILSLPQAQVLDKVRLQFGSDNYDYQATVEYSLDAEEWFPVAGDFRVLGIRNAQTDFQFSDLTFEPLRARYLRLRLLGSLRAPLLGASVLLHPANAPVEQHFTATAPHITQDKKRQQTVLTGSFRYWVPLQWIRFAVRDTFDFYRQVTIELRDTGGSVVSRQEGILLANHPEIRLPDAVSAKSYTLSIRNYDDMPLDIDSVMFGANPVILMIRFPDPGARYYLQYGQAETPPPRYDLNHFPSVLPDAAPWLRVGPEEPQTEGQQPIPKNQSKDHRVFLWAALVGIVILLGLATLRMMRQK